MRQPQALKSVRRHQRFHEDDRAEAQQQPDRNREPDPGAPEGAVFRSRRLFDHPGRGGAELGAETDALQQPEQDEQHRRDHADAVVDRRQPDRQRAHAHQHQRINHRVPAPLPVGDMAENKRADRADDDAEAINADRRGHCRKARKFEENTAPDGRRDYAGDEKVVLLDHRADDAGERDFINLLLGRTRGCDAHLPSPHSNISRFFRTIDPSIANPDRSRQPLAFQASARLVRNEPVR